MKIDPRLFALAQKQMMAQGAPEDPCGRCGCRRKNHLPGKTFSYSKSGGSSGKSHELAVLAPTSCDCHYCLCFCTGFVEPFKGQPFLCCTYEPQKDFHKTAEISTASKTLDDRSRMLG